MSSPHTPTPSTPSPTPLSPLTTISTNWPSTQIPPSIPLPPSPPYSLLSALATLSTLTPHQPTRAFALLSTYFQMRIREASYAGTCSSGIFAVLEATDVERAIGSVRRMSVGMGMEVENGSRCGSVGGGVSGCVRKWSIKDERKVDEEEDVDVLAAIDDDVDEDIRASPILSLPPLSAYFPTTPTTPTPLFPNRQLPPILPRLQIPNTPHLQHDELVAASQKATHETNLRRRDLEAAERAVVDARTRYEDARVRAEGLRAEVKKLERERM